MTFQDRAYRTLVVSSSSKFLDNISQYLNDAQCNPISFASSITDAKRMSMENPFDFIIINSPLPDELGAKFAIDVSAGKETVCLLLCRADLFEEIKAKVTPHGVFTLSKPINATSIAQSLAFLAPARERLRKLEKKSLSLEEKMEEIRLVNKAKWLLIDHEQLSEPDAHRMIEKQAMDKCVLKGEIAKTIIKKYE